MAFYDDLRGVALGFGLEANRLFGDEQRLQDRNGVYSFSNWLFFVDDEQADLAISAESITSDETGPLKDVIVARGDPTIAGALQDLAPSSVFSLSDLAGLQYQDAGGTSGEYDDFADHWHVYAHGYHWIAISVVGDMQALGVYLLQLTIPADGSAPVIVAGALVFTPTSADYFMSPFGGTKQPKYVTNDLLLVDTRLGVAIGIKHRPDDPVDPRFGRPDPGKGHLIIDVTAPGPLPGFHVERRVKVIGASSSATYGPGAPGVGVGAAPYSHDNGASANVLHLFTAYEPGSGSSTTTSRYLLFAPEHITVNNPGGIRLIVLNSDFEPLHVETLVDTDGAMSHSMPTTAWIPPPGRTKYLGNPDTTFPRAMVWKRFHSPDADSLYGGWDDYGLLFLRLYGPNGSEEDRQMSREGWRANRPHVTYWKDYLIVGWDGGPWELVYDPTTGAPGIVTSPDGRQQYDLDWPGKGCHATIYQLGFR
jgi:hypothetical protein